MPCMFGMKVRAKQRKVEMKAPNIYFVSSDVCPFLIQRTAFNANAAYCNGVYPSDNTMGSNSQCFDHSWETPTARSHLWSSCTVEDRTIGRIFLSDVKNRVLYGGFLDKTGTCDVELITTLEEAHAIGVEVYALFSTNDAAFSEKDSVGFVNDFNTNCGTANGKFDGVSVNNEHFTSIKSCIAENQAAQLQFLDNLQATKDIASPLPLHFSFSWNWDCCSCSSSSYSQLKLTWNGSFKSAVEHMIDIVDSVDVQVAWNEGSTMIRRSFRPYQYWLANKAGTTTTTAFYVLAYTNPNSDCRLSFAPHTEGSTTATDTCSTGDRTESGMFAAFDEVQSNMTDSHGAIHFMGGVFSSGMPGWPKHEGAPTPTAMYVWNEGKS